MRHLFR